MSIDLAMREHRRALPAPTLQITDPASPANPFMGVGRILLPLALVGLASVTPFVDSGAAGGLGDGVLAALAALTVLCAVTGHPGCARLGIGLTATVAASALLPWWLGWWPLPGLVGVGAYLISYVMPRGNWSRHRGILRLGRRLTAAETGLAVGLIFSSGSVLLIFSFFAPPRLGAAASFLTGLTPWPLVAAGAVFAVVNAFVEEVLFRGAVLHHLRGVLGIGPAVLVQAVAFGVLHLNGYPHGPVGVVLASIYGLLLGALRVRSGGLLAPWIAHVCADVVIFVLIVRAAM
jgi:membrane protease YdiL (CAAX protease family)